MTDERLGQIAVALLLAEFDGISSEGFAEDLMDLEIEVLGLGICSSAEAKEMGEKIQSLYFTKQIPPETQEEQARRFADQYPPDVLADIALKRKAEMVTPFM